MDVNRECDLAFFSINQLERSEVEDEKVLTAEDTKEDLPVKVSYVSKDQRVDFSYQSLDTGIKETITLSEKPKSGRMTFKFYAKGLEIRENALDGGLTLIDKKTDDNYI